MHSVVDPLPSLACRSLIDRNHLKALARPAPIRLLFQTALEWMWIILLAAIAAWCDNLAVTIVCMLLIATRQHALLTLMHEYSHYQFSRRHAWLNDLIGDVLTAFPFFITVHGFRRNHLPHHRYVATDKDPDWISTMKKERYRFPKTRKQVYLEILKHCLGWYTLQDMKGYTVGSGMATHLPRAVRISRGVFALLVAAAATWFHQWPTVLLYWFVPLATFLMGILYVRDLAEHLVLPAPGIAASRTVVAGWLDRLLFGQNGVNFHTEHHLYPAVPFCRLKQLHVALMESGRYRDQAVLTHGYLSGLIDEMCAANRTSAIAGR